LFKIKLIPADAQLFADFFCRIQGKNLFFAHNIKLITIHKNGPALWGVYPIDCS
jgi:hypothetical protein